MDKKGQMAIFVIVALAIVAVVLVIVMYPQIKNLVMPAPVSPSKYLELCLQPEVNKAVTTLAEQGGELNPVGYITYDGKKVKYLCYVTGYYKTCVVQQPLLVSNFAKELSAILTPKADACMRRMKTDYESKGYSVSITDTKSETSMALGKVEIKFNSPVTLTLEETVQVFNNFDMLSIAASIVQFEATYGDSEITAYTQYYPDLKIYKIKLADGIKIYKVADVITKESFTFATRSMVWPAGYGLE
jgi:hypothetical protein